MWSVPDVNHVSGRGHRILVARGGIDQGRGCLTLYLLIFNYCKFNNCNASSGPSSLVGVNVDLGWAIWWLVVCVFRKSKTASLASWTQTVSWNGPGKSTLVISLLLHSPLLHLPDKRNQGSWLNATASTGTVSGEVIPKAQFQPEIISPLKKLPEYSAAATPPSLCPNK